MPVLTSCELFEVVKIYGAITAQSYAIAPVLTYAHELGHAVAAKILFNNTSSTITLKSYGWAGRTFSKIGAPSDIGKFLGIQKSRTLITAAGPMFEVICRLGLSRYVSNYNLFWDSIMDLEMAIDSLHSDPPLDPEDDAEENDFVKIKRGASPFIYKALTSVIFASTALFFHGMLRELYAKVGKAIQYCSQDLSHGNG